MAGSDLCPFFHQNDGGSGGDGSDDDDDDNQQLVVLATIRNQNTPECGMYGRLT